MPPTSTPYPTQYPSQYPFSGAYPPNNAATPYPTPNSAATPYPPLSTSTTYPYPTYNPSYTSQPPTTQSTPQLSPGTGTITEEHIRVSLISAIEDKMKSRLKEKVAQFQAEIDVLKKTSNFLIFIDWFNICFYLLIFLIYFRRGFK
jgi:ESCRT-I complex subunit TSG101